MNDEVKGKERLNEIRWNGKEMRKEKKKSGNVEEQEKKENNIQCLDTMTEFS